MNILGVYDGHNSGAALLEDGVVVAAAEEERFSRIKNHDGRLTDLCAPLESVRECLSRASGRIDVVAFALETPKLLAVHLQSTYANALRDGQLVEDPTYPLAEVVRDAKAFQANRARKIAHALAVAGVEMNAVHVSHVDHHAAHAASAYFTCGHHNALVVTCDGKGDNLSATVSRGADGTLRRIRQIDHLSSVGHLYSAVTAACGFRPLRHEGKLLGLAARGMVNLDLLRRLETLFEIRAGTIAGKLNQGNKLGAYPQSIISGGATHLRRLSAVLDGYDLPDIAATVQQFLEHLVIAFIQPYLATSDQTHLVVAGGVFANVRLNERLARLPDVTSFYVHPAMSDAGLALGAALDAYSRCVVLHPAKLTDVFWGPVPSHDDCNAAARTTGLSIERPGDINARVAQLLAGGKVVCRLHGRMECGPRALGNRSILCAANDPSVIGRLNRQLHRTETMPFAPATLDEQMERCYDVIPAARACDEFMTLTYPCSSFTKRHCPATVHVDGSARPQRVCRQSNPSLHAILTHYRLLTGLPSVINTSFNIHEEPIVCSPADAVRAFLKTDLDCCQLGEFLVYRGQ